MRLLGILVLDGCLIYRLCKTLKWLFEQRKKLFKRQAKIKCIVHSIIVVVLVISIVSLSITAKAQITQQAEGRFVEKIAFESEIINDKITVWQELIETNLYYSSLEEQMKKNFSNDQIRNHYIQGIGIDDTLSAVDFQQVYRMYEKFYDTELLPVPEKTLAEIEVLTPPLEERSKADPDLFREEFALRVQQCTEMSSFECLYQTGRSADDTFKRLVEEKNTKEIVFFAAMAVSFYMLSLEKLEEDQYLTWSFIEYKIAEIYFYIQDKCNIQDDAKKDLYDLHFLLAAEAYFKHSQVMFEMSESQTSIHEEQTYHNQYLAEVQYKLIISDIFEEKDKMKDECRLYAEAYIKDPCAKQNGIDSCNSYISLLDNI